MTRRFKPETEEIVPERERDGGPSPGEGSGGGPLRPGPAERLGVLESMRWRWGTALVPVLVFVSLGAILGLMRDPVRTASTRLEVRVQATSANAVPAAVSAAEEIASDYARDLGATEVVKRIARRTGLPEAKVRQSLSASPIVDSPVVEVEATATAGQAAIRLANIGGDELRRYVERANEQTQERSAEITRKAKQAIVEYERRFAAERELEREFGPDLSSSQERALERARVSTQFAAFRRDALRQAFAAAQAAYRAPLVPLTRATSASSDLVSMLQLLLAAGLAAGLFVGAALATFRANRSGGRFP